MKLFPSLEKRKCAKLKRLDIAQAQLCVEEGTQFKEENLNFGTVLDGVTTSPSVVTIKVKEKASYTTTLELKFNAPSNIVKKNLKLILRMYHDAKMLEVMDGISVSELSAIRAIQDKSSYPVKFADEKRQLNRFLGESLKYCLKISRDKVELTEPNGSQN